MHCPRLRDSTLKLFLSQIEAVVYEEDGDINGAAFAEWWYG